MTTDSGRLSGSRKPSPTVSALTGFDPSRMSPMGAVMLAGEEDLGRKGVWPHHKRLPQWLNIEDWACWPIVAYDKREVHIVAVWSARKGALRRLVDNIIAAGMVPVVVGPFSQMLAIMRRWRWVKTVIDEGTWDEREEWRPASAIEARSDATGTGAAEGESATAESGDAQPLPPHPKGQARSNKSRPVT